MDFSLIVPATIVKPPENQTVHVGEDAKFECEVTGRPSPVVEFLVNGERVRKGAREKVTSEGNVHCLTVRKCRTGRTITVNAYNAAGSDTKTAVLEVISKPTFARKPTNVTVTAPTSILLEWRVKGSPEPDFAIRKNGKDLTEGVVSHGGVHTVTLSATSSEDSGTYSAVCSNSAGSAECTTLVTVVEPAKITKPLNDVGLKEGEALQLEVAVTGTQPIHAEWQKDDFELDVTGPACKAAEKDGTYTLTIDKPSADDGGKYALKVWNAVGHDQTSAVVAVQGKPTILRELQSVEAMEKEQVILEAEVSGTSLETVWLKDGGGLHEDSRVKFRHTEQMLSLNIADCLFEDSGTYTLLVKNKAGQVETQAALTVHCPPEIQTPLHDKELIEGDDVVFTAKVYARPAADVTWYLNGKALEKSDEFLTTTKPDENLYSLTIKGATTKHSGEYKLVASNESGVAETTAKLSVEIVPEFVKPLEDTSLEEGQQAVLNVTVKGVPMPELSLQLNDQPTDEKNFILKPLPETGAYQILIPSFKPDFCGTLIATATNVAGSCKSTCQIDAKGRCQLHSALRISLLAFFLSG